MKFNIKVLLLIAMASMVFTKTQAQTEIQVATKTYSEVFDSLSTGLNPSRIPYGTLIDRTYIWSGLDAWKNNDTTSTKHLYQSWYDAEQAVVNLADRPNRYSNMRTKVQQQNYQVRLPLVNINYKFGYFDSLALTDGRLSVNNGMMIDNNLASPYLIKQVGIAGLALDKLEANKQYALQFDTTLAINNTGITIQNVNLNNITTGQSVTITTNQAAILLSFNQVGKNVLKFTTTMSNGSSYSNYQTVNIDANSSTSGILNRPNGPSCDPTNDIVESNIPFQGYEETEATNSFADYHIYYHTVNLTGIDNCQIGGQRKLLKPIIIMDGFDPQNERSYSEIYKDQLVYSNNLTKLGDELRDKGYDVIILNFPKLGSIIKGVNGVADTTIPKDVKVNGTTSTVERLNRDGGTDYMERNAFILVKLIQEVNATLQASSSAEKLVVIGPSMGGQISRYALAYMEKQNSLGVPDMNHNTRLFLSFDSPNDGANIPVALAQNLYFFGNFAGQQDAKDSYNQKLHSIAARQLLIEQLDGLNSNALFHQTFFNSLRNGGLPNSGGYPINCRKVSLLNGNGQSLKTYNDGVEILNLHGVENNVLGFIAEDNFLPSYGQNIRLAKTRLIIPNIGLGGCLSFGIFTNYPCNIAFFNGRYSPTNFNSHGSMDASQGSTFDATNEVYEGFKKALTKKNVTEQNESTPLKPNHCFIPSISALAFKNNNFNWNDNVVNRNLLCNNEIWYDNYFIPKTNENHITLTTENVEWIAQEIDKGQPNCPTICSYAINGANDLCINSVNTYTLDVPIPVGYTIIWEPSTAYQIISSTNNSVTIRGLLNIKSAVKAHIINPCGADVFITKEIFVGIPSYTASYKNGITANNQLALYLMNPTPQSYNNVCLGYNCLPNVYIESQPYGVANVTWTTPNGYNDITPFNICSIVGNKAYFGWPFGGTNAPGYLQGSVSNSCGTYTQIFAFQQTNCGTTGGDPCAMARSVNYFTISPNPASDNITIGVSNRPAPVECNGMRALTTADGLIFSAVNVYNNLGTLVKSYKTHNAKSATIQISNLLIGSYLVEIIQGDYIEKQHIIVQ